MINVRGSVRVLRTFKNYVRVRFEFLYISFYFRVYGICSILGKPWFLVPFVLAGYGFFPI